MKLRQLFPFFALASLLPFNASAVIRYVDVNSPAPTPPYTNWPTAATNIQDAIDAAAEGDEVVVTNGTYATGGRVVYGALTNRVVVDKALTVRSVNGPTLTVIEGNPVLSDSAVRCVYLTNHTMLEGFTVRKGGTRRGGYTPPVEGNGGGVWCESSSALVTNCILCDNLAYFAGGGAWTATLNNCVLARNSANDGGGAAYCVLNSCLVISNRAFFFSGGGAFRSTVNNCTLTGNLSQEPGSSIVPLGGNHTGGGAYGCTLNASIIYYNDATDYPNSCYGSLQYCCTTDLAAGPGNFTNEPAFLDRDGLDLRLQANSPCINSGNNSYLSTSTDLDGNPRISGGTVDVGAYEFQLPSSVISYAWLQQYGCPPTALRMPPTRMAIA